MTVVETRMIVQDLESRNMYLALARMTKIVFFFKESFSFHFNATDSLFYWGEVGLQECNDPMATAVFLCGHLPDSCQRNRVAVDAMALTNVFQFNSRPGRGWRMQQFVDANAVRYESVARTRREQRR